MIRKWEEKDLDAVMDIWLKANIHAHDFINSDYWMSQFEMVKDMIPQALVYVYESDDAILGFVGLMNAYVAGIFIDQHHQSRGIGTKLLNEIKKHQHYLTLTVYEKNVKAIRFYQKSGFCIRDKQIDLNTKEAEYLMVWENS